MNHRKLAVVEGARRLTLAAENTRLKEENERLLKENESLKEEIERLQERYDNCVYELAESNYPRD